MKHGAILLNVSRGGLVNSDELMAGLERGQLGGLGMDVWENECEQRAQLAVCACVRARVCVCVCALVCVCVCVRGACACPGACTHAGHGTGWWSHPPRGAPPPAPPPAPPLPPP
jgi:hypothetical protein